MIIYGGKYYSDDGQTFGPYTHELQKLAKSPKDRGHLAGERVATTMRPIFHVLDLSKRGIGIFQQLKIEEALFRADKSNRNWLILNSLGSVRERAVVFGLGDGRKPHKLCNVDLARADGIPLIKRYTGGGTVFVDDGTRFITFICNDNILADSTAQDGIANKDLLLNSPRPIMKWTGDLYKGAFDKIFKAYGKSQIQDNGEEMQRNRNLFDLRENDYIFDKRKFGGNAQSISKNRWVHHTSFLYDFDVSLMSKYLFLPEKQPEYRDHRDHDSFLCKMKDIFPETAPPVALEEALLEVLGRRNFNLKFMNDENAFDSIQEIINQDGYRQSNVLL